MIANTPRPRVAILAIDGLFDLGFASILDTMSIANELNREPIYELEVVGLQKKVVSQRGSIIPTVRAKWDETPDIVVVPALGAKSPEALVPALAARPVVAACELLRAWGAGGATIAAACTGTFVLATSGLLDGHRATTTWWLAPLFRERFPDTELDDGNMIVASAPFVTAGAALAHLDLALWLIRRQSPSLAALTARYLMIDTRPSQAAFAIPDHLMHDDDLVRRFESWVRKNLVDRFSLEEAAKKIGASPRTLQRKVQNVLGKSPIAFVQDLRVERAIHLIRTSNDSMDTIAERVGYADAVTLRTLLRKKTGRGVRELRAADSERAR